MGMGVRVLGMDGEVLSIRLLGMWTDMGMVMDMGGKRTSGVVILAMAGTGRRRCRWQGSRLQTTGIVTGCMIGFNFLFWNRSPGWDGVFALISWRVWWSI